MKNIKKTFYYLFYLLGIVSHEKNGKKYILLKVIITVISPFISLIGIFIPGLLIDELTQSFRYNYIIIYVIVLTVAPCLWNIIQQVINHYYLDILRYGLNQKFEENFYKHVAKMDFDFFDKPYLADLQSQANEVIMNDVIGSVDSLCNFISTIIGLISLSTLITKLNLMVIIVIIITISINFFIARNHKRKLLEYEDEIKKRRRHKWVHTFLLQSSLYAKEVRLFRMGDFLSNKITESNKNMDELDHNINKHSVKANFGYYSTSIFQNLLVYAYTIFNVLNGTISIGYMSIFNSAASQLSGLLGSISGLYLALFQKGAKVQKYIDFMNLPSIQYESGNLQPEFNHDSVIEFKNVSFSYPGNERLVLNNLNLKIKGSEHLAIVGINGSGKSTFVKLITRLYKPTSGEILLNGINISKYDYEKYQELFSPVFQDFALYDMSIKENIALSDTADNDKLQAVSVMSGLESLLKKLTNGFDTQLGKNFDPEGVKLSGGEGQRLAIARARYYNRKIYLLDEPTAALDPYSENEIYSQFDNMIADKCAVLITHRLSAVQLANKIAVFHNGEVVEYGTHNELYSQGGRYTEMFDKQAQFYKGNMSSK